MNDFERPVNQTRKLLFTLVVIQLLSSAILYWRGISVLGASDPTGRIGDVTKSLVERVSLEAPEFRMLHEKLLRLSEATGQTYWQDAYSLGKHGELYPKHSPLSAILAAPFELLFGNSGFWILQQVLVLTLLFSVFELSRELSAQPVSSLLFVTCLLLTQTYRGPYTYAFAYDLHGMACIFGGLLLARKRGFLGALIFTLSVFFRPSHLILLPLLLLYYPHAKRAAQIQICLGILAGLSVFAFWNTWLYGGPLTTAYQRLPIYEAGKMVLDSHPVGFSWSIFIADWREKLFSSKVGLIFFNPLALLLPLVIWRTQQDRDLQYRGMILLGFSGLYTSYVFSYAYWSASSAGNRLLFPALYLYLVVCVAVLNRPRGISQCDPELEHSQ